MVIYHLPEPASMPVPISGRFLAHTRDSRIARAFTAADLHAGTKQLIKPTMVQAAFLARISTATLGPR
jgi:hypothetical protein